jgi:hypothetical protein
MNFTNKKRGKFFYFLPSPSNFNKKTKRNKF